MDARKLHDAWPKMDRHERGDVEHRDVILRALSLLASVEESKDEFVRRFISVIDDRAGDGPSGPNYDPELLEIGTEAAARLVALQRENAEIKGHAEAMAATLDTCAELHRCTYHALDAYRRAHPKETP